MNCARPQRPLSNLYWRALLERGGRRDLRRGLQVSSTDYPFSSNQFAPFFVYPFKVRREGRLRVGIRNPFPRVASFSGSTSCCNINISVLGNTEGPTAVVPVPGYGWCRQHEYGTQRLERPPPFILVVSLARLLIGGRRLLSSPQTGAAAAGGNPQSQLHRGKKAEEEERRLWPYIKAAKQQFFNVVLSTLAIVMAVKMVEGKVGRLAGAAASALGMRKGTLPPRPISLHACVHPWTR